MKKIFLILLLAGFELCAVSASGFKEIPQAWLNGISIRPITPSDSASVIMPYMAKPEAFVVAKDGIGELSLKQIQQNKKVPPVVLKTKFGKDASKMIAYAVKHHYWLFFKGSIMNFSNVFSVSLIPYDLETGKSLAGFAPEEPDEQWIVDGVTFCEITTNDLITEEHSPCFLGLDKANAIILNDGGMTSDWKKSYLHIDEVPASLVPFLRFLVKFQAHVHITYDKATRKIYKIRLDKNWNDTIIII